MTFKMTPYNEYIAKSRYARYLDSEGRREHWPETVERYMNFMQKHLKDKHNYTLTDDLYDKLYNSIVNLEVVPSMSHRRRCVIASRSSRSKAPSATFIGKLKTVVLSGFIKQGSEGNP